MKKLLCSILSLVILSSAVVGCGSKNDEQKALPTDTASVAKPSETTETSPTIMESVYEPTLLEIRGICQLATMECYYHNVCKATKSPGTGLTHLGEEERTFWFEYTATATLGIDFNLVEIVVDGSNITVYYPHAQILGDIHVDSDSTTNPICNRESFFANSNEITTDDVRNALAEANSDVREQIANDDTLLRSAEVIAEDLIENYIDQIMTMSGVEYTVNFAYIEDYQQ